MKQVIIKIRDIDGKLRAKEYFTNVAQFESFAQDFISNNMTFGYEVQIKIGNQYSVYKCYEELLDDAKYNCNDFEEEIFSLIQNCMYYVKNYLPKY